MKKIMNIIIVCILIVTVTSIAQQTSSETTGRKSFRQRLTELEEKVQTLTGRVDYLEQRLNSLTIKQNEEEKSDNKKDNKLEAKENAYGYSKQDIEKLEQSIQGFREAGLLYSMNIEDNEARCDVPTWLMLNIEQKQQAVMILSAYFEAKGSTRRVTVLSNLNDEKLATFSSWNGLKIFK
jgi:TolA-binding protein